MKNTQRVRSRLYKPFFVQLSFLITGCPNKHDKVKITLSLIKRNIHLMFVLFFWTHCIYKLFSIFLHAY